MRLIQLSRTDRSGQSPVVRLAGHFSTLHVTVTVIPVDDQLADERVLHIPGRFFCDDSCGPAQDLVLLHPQPVPASQRALVLPLQQPVSAFRLQVLAATAVVTPGRGRPNIGFSQPLTQTRLGDFEVSGDLRDRHFGPCGVPRQRRREKPSDAAWVRSAPFQWRMGRRHCTSRLRDAG